MFEQVQLICISTLILHYLFAMKKCDRCYDKTTMHHVKCNNFLMIINKCLDVFPQVLTKLFHWKNHFLAFKTVAFDMNDVPYIFCNIEYIEACTNCISLPKTTGERQPT